MSAGDNFLNEPVHITWDGNGNLYVAQMETYMQDSALLGLNFRIKGTNGDSPYMHTFGNLDNSICDTNWAFWSPNNVKTTDIEPFFKKKKYCCKNSDFSSNTDSK